MENNTMATTYKFMLHCYQEQAGSEDAKITVKIGDTTVLSEATITSTDVNNPTLVIFEATGLADVAADAQAVLSVAMLNDLYVDESTDRNMTISAIKYCDKADGTNYKYWKHADRDWDSISDASTTGWLPWEATGSQFANQVVSAVAHDNGIAYDWDGDDGYITIYDNDYVDITCDLTESTSPADWTNGAYVKN